MRRSVQFMLFLLLLWLFVLYTGVGQAAAAVTSVTTPVGSTTGLPQAPVAPVPIINEWRLAIGESRLFEFDRVTRVAVGDPAIADVVVLDEKTVLLNPKATGATLLFIWHDNLKDTYSLVVTSNTKLAADAIAKAVPQARVELIPVQNSLVVRGTVGTAHERDLVLQIAAQFSGTVIPDLVITGGENNATGNSAEMLANVIRTVAISAQVIEVDRQQLLDLGVQWPKPLATVTGMGSLLHVNWALPELNLAIASGAARVLSEPRIQVVSGYKADMLAGGEFPIPTTSSDVTWKEYGVKLEVTPVVEGSLVKADVKVEVTRLDWTTTVGTLNLPSLRVRRASAQVMFTGENPVVLCGLTQTETATTQRHIPFLGSLPVIGWLFRYSDDRSIETEVVIVLEAKLVTTPLEM